MAWGVIAYSIDKISHDANRNKNIDEFLAKKKIYYTSANNAKRLWYQGLAGIHIAYVGTMVLRFNLDNQRSTKNTPLACR